MPPEPAIAAHRGGALLWPENSLTAIARAAALPIEQVEIDVHLSADGVPVAIHDATLDRTTETGGPVRARTAAELRGCALRGARGEGVPTLEDAAALVREAGRVLRLELKADGDGVPYPGGVAACLAVLDRTAMRSRTVLIAFAPRDVADVAAGLAGTALLFGARAWHGLGPSLAVALAQAAGATELGVPFGCASTAALAACRAARLGFGAWGVDTPAEIAAARALGLDVLTTDDPVAAVAAREASAAVAAREASEAVVAGAAGRAVAGPVPPGL